MTSTNPNIYIYIYIYIYVIMLACSNKQRHKNKRLSRDLSTSCGLDPISPLTLKERATNTTLTHQILYSLSPSSSSSNTTHCLPPLHHQILLIVSLLFISLQVTGKTKKIDPTSDPINIFYRNSPLILFSMQ